MPAILFPRAFHHPAIKSGFTLIELLVVVSLISLLISILLPALQTARMAAKNVLCLNHLNQLGVATHVYATDFRDQMPYHSKQDYTLHNWPALTEQRMFRTDMGLGISNGPDGLGRLWGGRPGYPAEAGSYITARQTFYCPSQIDPRFQLGTPENTWGSVVSTRPGYTYRSGVLTAQQKNEWDRTQHELQGNKSLIVDAVLPPGYDRSTHTEWFNVSYIDGSAKTIPNVVETLGYWRHVERFIAFDHAR